MIKVVIDTNVVLDWILGREPFKDTAEKMFEIITLREDIKAYVTANSVTDIFYVAKKTMKVDKIRNLLLIIFKKVDIVSILKSDIIKSLKSDYKDLEDALQITCALKIHADYLITRDKEMYSKEIRIITPEEFIKVFSS
ncbi:PIN domain-containing protein [Caldicellulosiruptor morganii]|uniref:PIN domain-containing protein n=1 Tax=Caldicellulosiruptor morganii TaxID=1387555 RepID=A0ABY7BMH7_9FIRM|nr:PIN domain-containing protein [Caldicellulosiruptor morganii]WAM34024.1 PIN domain-containing protein [Caldicellulosiruptor morganii]